jgi:hypothetical protein
MTYTETETETETQIRPFTAYITLLGGRLHYSREVLHALMREITEDERVGFSDSQYQQRVKHFQEHLIHTFQPVSSELGTVRLLGTFVLLREDCLGPVLTMYQEWLDLNKALAQFWQRPGAVPWTR